MALPPDRIEDLLESIGADGVIVVASVASVVDSAPRAVERGVVDEQGPHIPAAPPVLGSPSEPAQLVTLNVEDVLAGRVKAKQVTVSKPPAPYWLSTVAPDNAGVFFLRRDESGAFVIAGHFGPFSIPEEEARRVLAARAPRRRWWQRPSRRA
jgi:hypothetical protein